MKILIAFIALSLAACTSSPQTKDNNFSHTSEFEISGDFTCEYHEHDIHKIINNKEYHLLRSNRDGLHIDPLATNEIFSRAEPTSRAVGQMQKILCGAEKISKHKNWDKVNIVFFVHGGLNGFNASDKRLKKNKLVIDQGKYPIYLAWPSGPASTWSEHIFRIREGKKTNKLLGAISSPFVFTSDILKSIGNYPSTALYQGINEKDRVASLLHSSYLSNTWEDSHLVFCKDKNTDIQDCEKKPIKEYSLQANYSNYKPSNTVVRGGAQLITFPIRYTVGSLWHSGISSAAWENMKRRAKNISYPTHEFDSRYAKGLNSGVFFKMMLERAKFYRKQYQKDYEITLIGHSMGSIVINNALNRYQASWIETPFLENIVYMAGAASINDSLNSLSSVLVERNRTENNQRFTPNFYNLTLNRVAEISEMHYLGIIPTGSLLVSIDQHHDKPEHPLNRTIGSEVNVLSSLRIIDEALSMSTGKKVFKSFDKLEQELPKIHGDFGKMPFWDEKIWQIN